MKPDLTIAQLSIVDGAWQEAPEHLACFDAASLFEGNVERGNLYIVVEVSGEPEGRDALARALIETVRREYAASRGSIALGLMQAVRAANDFFYTTNANTEPEARRLAGITAVIARDNELFIAQGGPGLTCVVRGKTLVRYPEESPWFNPNEAEIAAWLGTRNFSTPGEVPIGMRRNYIPDIFHTTVLPGDIVVLATRALVQLLTNEELIDTVANRHPDEIVAALEDVAGATDLSAIVLRVAGEAIVPTPAPMPETTEEAIAPASSPTSETAPASQVPVPPPPVTTPTEEELAWEQIRAERERERQRLQEERAQAQRQEISRGVLHLVAQAARALAGLGTRIDWTRIGNAVDRALDALVRGLARGLAFLIRAITPGEPKTSKTISPSSRPQTAWKLAALTLPILLILLGMANWVIYRTEQQAALERRLTQLVQNANGRLEEAKRLQTTDRAAAREAIRQALEFLEQARALRPNDPRVASTLNRAQDLLDEVNGIAVIFPSPPFANFTDPKSKITRIVTRVSDVFLFDRGLQRIYRYTINEVGSSATPVAGEGVILKSGDRVDNRTVGEIFDVVWLEAGRLIALDRNGAYYQFDLARNTWSARAANEPAAWARATLATTYANNLYLIDPSRNQILKYVSPSPDVVWTASVTYFAPGVTPPDLSTAIDLAIDGEVWLVRADGSVSRFYDGRPREITLSGLDTPVTKPLALITTERMIGLYLVDAGNQRVLQFDKTNGRLARQFKPHSQGRDTFKALQAFAVDEPNRRFVFVSGGKAYLATIPQ
ncbi:MAG: hypothetical protein N2559_07180 [Anaerolineae bacterium]|nr:hypothetical protein [Anaerolineae bacterium]